MLKRFMFLPDFSFVSRPLRWVILIGISLLIAYFLEEFRIPAAQLLGPMIAAIIIALINAGVNIPKLGFTSAQGIIGCMISTTITNETLIEIMHDWPLFLSGVFGVIILAYSIGFILAKKQILPGTTAIWGSAPGAASVMVIMSQAYGADERFVAVMQYSRVAVVAGLASLLALILLPSDYVSPEIIIFPQIEYFNFFITLLIAFGASLAATFLKIPAGGVLVPLVIATILQDTGLVTIFLPPWLLIASYTIIGWTIGLRFTRAIISYALKALPILVTTTFLLVGTCAIFALIMSYLTGIDFLTAYLATSPGGADSVAIIAINAPVNMSFIMAFQIMRFIIVTITGPIISQFISKSMKKK